MFLNPYSKWFPGWRSYGTANFRVHLLFHHSNVASAASFALLGPLILK